MNSVNHLEQQQCRTCYNSTYKLKLLASFTKSSPDETNDKTYSQLLLEVCNINVMDDTIEQWPQFICLNCCIKLESAHNFIQQTRKINLFLKSIADMLKIESRLDFIEKPALDIPFDIKMEKYEGVEFLPNERVFQYSPIDSEMFSEESTPISNKFDNPCVNNDPNEIENKVFENGIDITKEVVQPSTIEFVSNDLLIKKDLNKPHIENINNIDKKMRNNNPSLTNGEYNKLFTRSSRLNRRKRFIHVADKNKNSCHLCDQKFTRCDNLKRHLKNVHKQKKSLQKKVVQKNPAFKPKANIARKFATLTCYECNKVFDTFNGLSRHKRSTHAPEEKKINCNFCGHKFGRQDHFKRHMERVHGTKIVSRSRNEETKGTGFFCNKCERSYSCRSNLNKHIRKFHIQ